VTAVVDWANDRDLEFEDVVSLGNKAVLDEGDFVTEWGDDDETDVVPFLEGQEIRVLGIVPRVTELAGVTVGDLVETLGADLLTPDVPTDAFVERFTVCDGERRRIPALQAVARRGDGHRRRPPGDPDRCPGGAGHRVSRSHGWAQTVERMADLLGDYTDVDAILALEG